MSRPTYSPSQTQPPQMHAPAPRASFDSYAEQAAPGTIRSVPSMQHLAEASAGAGADSYQGNAGGNAPHDPPMLVTGMMQDGPPRNEDERYATVPHPSPSASASMSPAPPDLSNGMVSPAPSHPGAGPIPSSSSTFYTSNPPSHLALRQQSASSVTSAPASNGSLGPGTGNGAAYARTEDNEGGATPLRVSSVSAGAANGIGMSGAGTQPMQSAPAEIVPVSFDEGVLRALCDLDCALPLITERIKQGISSCKQVATFFRSRADLEDKYARSLSELVRMSGESYGRSYCKAGSFVEAYHASLRVHETIAQNRTRFAQRLVEMSEELLSLAREGERLRKLHKENGMRYERNLQESEMAMEKAKSRFDSTAEELERILVTKEGEKDSGMHPGGAGGPGGSGAAKEKRSLGKAMKGGIFKGKGPAQMQRQEDEVRGRMSIASEVFRKAVLESQAVRQEYFGLQLPKILRLLKECADEIDLGTQYHLARYAFLYEATILGDGAAVQPMGVEDGPGLKSIVETIDSRSDFKTYMQNFAVARGSVRGPRREGMYENGFSPALPPHVLASQQQANHQHQQSIASSSGHGHDMSPMQTMQTPMPGGYVSQPNSSATFGVALGEQMVRDGTDIPKVVGKCVQAIEKYGLESKGIYRLSGTTSKVQKLKAAFDRDVDAVDLDDDEWIGDINNVASVLKLWFRELPEPLLTHGLYQGFIDAARYDNDRLRHIRLHEQVNELPDENYATLKFFMGHLDKVRRNEHITQMSNSNLSIVFGPTLLGPPPTTGANLQDMSFQCKAIETILERYKEIFVEEEDGAPAG